MPRSNPRRLSIPLSLESLESRAVPAVVLSPASVAVPEGQARQVSFKLTKAPTADVSFTLQSSNPAEATIDKTSLTFTPVNWRTPQAVTITAVEDLAKDGNKSLTIVTAAAGSAFHSIGSYDGSTPYPTIAITHYKAMAGVASQGKVAGVDKGAAGITDNGGMPLKGPKTVDPDNDDLPYLGLDMDAIRDGTSTTILLTESKEGGNSAWIDGMQAFVVALADDSPALPTLDGKTWTVGSAVSALGYGPSAAAPTRTSLNLGNRGTRGNSAWGPSSDHAGGMVTTGFGDGHLTNLAPDIDPAVYFGLVTRASGETVNAE